MDVFKNLALSQVDVAPNPPTSGTSITLTPGTGAFFPPAPFTITVFDGNQYATPTNAELIRVTAIVGDTLSGLIRGAETTTPRAIVAGDYVTQAFTAALVADLTNNSNQSAGTLPDARLSTNVALKNAANVFTQIQAILMTTTYPELQLQFTGDSIKGRVTVVAGYVCLAENLSYTALGWTLDDATKPGLVLSLGPDGGFLVQLVRAGTTNQLITLLQLDANGNLYIAGALTGGTIPDARLSANVALVNAANVFTQNQRLSLGLPRFQLFDTSQPVNARLFEILNNSQGLYFQSVDDALTTAYGYMMLDRAGVLTVGGGLGSTPLNASQLLQGTVPDARLSANVALKNVNNYFVAQTFPDGCWFSGTYHLLYFQATAAPANSRVTRWLDYGDGRFRFECLTDDISAIQSTPLQFDRAGNVLVGTDIYEKGRATPLGHWIDVPFSASNFGSTGTAAFAVSNQAVYAYSFVGKTVEVSFYLVGSLADASATELHVALPGGAAARYAWGGIWIILASGVKEMGFVYTAPGDGWLHLYRATQAAFPAGATTVAGAITVSQP